MVSVSDKDRPAFNTRSQTWQHLASDQSTAQEHVTLVITPTSDPTPKSLTADRLEALLQMQKTDLFCRQISKHYPMERHLSRRWNFLPTLRDFYTNISLILDRSFLL